MVISRAHTPRVPPGPYLKTPALIGHDRGVRTVCVDRIRRGIGTRLRSRDASRIENILARGVPATSNWPGPIQIWRDCEHARRTYHPMEEKGRRQVHCKELSGPALASGKRGSKKNLILNRNRGMERRGLYLSKTNRDTTPAAHLLRHNS